MEGLGVTVPYAGLAAAPRHHDVLFYDADDEMTAAAADHVSAGLAEGKPALVVVTAPHAAAIDAALSHRGVNVSRARAAGWYRTEDATQTLASIMVDGSPDPERFTRVVGAALHALPAARPVVHAMGEMVALLWQQGNVTGALALECLWNNLAGHREFALLCAYPTTALSTAGLADVNQVCHLHSTVLPPSSYGSAESVGLDDGAALASGVFVAVPEAVAAARRLVSETLTGWGEHHLVWEGSLIMSELATNAITHGGSPFRASVERGADVLCISVEDVGPGLPESRRGSQDALGGRGVAIVEELAHRWGCDRIDGGKVFWAELEATSTHGG